jgi:hypothetical protein
MVKILILAIIIFVLSRIKLKVTITYKDGQTKEKEFGIYPLMRKIKLNVYNKIFNKIE